MSSIFATLGRLAVHFLGEIVGPSHCAACELPVGAHVLFCPSCAATVERAPARSQCLATFDYGGAIATAISRLKYAERPDLGERLGRAMLPVVSRVGGAIDVITPVPLHPQRLA